MMGSGRKYGKRCTDNMRSVDVRNLRRDGLLKPGSVFELSWTWRGKAEAAIAVAVTADRVRFVYCNSERGGPWEDVDCTAMLDHTPMHFGGVQTWWRCPCCHRRAALLYVGRTMACRHCWNLAYRSERETEEDRALRRAGRIRRRLGWEPGIANGRGTKPKGMHWRTFWKLCAEHDAYANQALGMLQAWLRRR